MTLELGCDDVPKCNYKIDPDMSNEYSNFFIDKFTISNINTSSLIDDANDFETNTIDGSVVAVKTLNIPSLSVDCYVHFNGKMAAEYVTKRSNNMSANFRPKIRLEFSFVVR